MPRSHQNFRPIPAVKLLGILLRSRCWPTTFHTNTAGDTDGGCQNWPVPLIRLCSQRPMFIFPEPTERMHSAEYVMGNLLVNKQFRLQRGCVLLILKPNICSSIKYCKINIHRRSQENNVPLGLYFVTHPQQGPPHSLSATLFSTANFALGLLWWRSLALCSLNLLHWTCHNRSSLNATPVKRIKKKSEIS